MDQRLRPLANTLGDLFYNPMVRKIVGGIVAVWVLTLVLGIEVLTGTTHSPEYVSDYDSSYTPGSYLCSYWTGIGWRYQQERESDFTGCPVWRWGRQYAD